MQEENSKNSLPESPENKENPEASPSVEKKKKNVWDILQYVGLGLCMVQLIITVVFATLCYQSVLPKDYVLLGTSVLFLLVAIMAFLQKWKIPGIIGKVFSVIFSVVLIVGCGYLHTTNSGIGKITEDPTKHTDSISVYVRCDSEVKSLAECQSLIVGIMKNEYGSVQSAVSNLEEKYGIEINAVTYDNAADLFTDLQNNDINVAICNSDVLGLLTEADGYTGIEVLFTEIETLEVTVFVKEDEPTGTPKPNSGVLPTNEPEVTPEVTDTPEVTADPEVSDTPEPTADPEVTSTPTPTPTYALKYLTSDPYIPYTEYHTGNDHVFTVLVNGVDQQSGFVGRGDVNIMITVNLNTHQIFMVTTPRDSYLPISCFDWQYDKLTHATALGGIKGAMDTLTNLYGVKCDYYIRVNFAGVQALIDAIGGVTVNSDSEFDTCYGTHIYEGVNELNGIEALGFARTRYGVTGGEQSRGIHQMEVIRAAIAKCTQSTALLTNYSAVMAAAGDNMKTSIPESMISSLISNQISTMQGWDVVTYNITGTSDSGLWASYALKANAWMMIPDYTTVEKARNYFHQIYNDELIQK